MVNVSKNTLTGNLLFNICGYKSPPPNCVMGFNSVAYFSYSTGCYPLSNDASSNSTTWSVGPLNPSNHKLDGFEIIENTTASQIPLNLTFSFNCNQNVTGLDPKMSYIQYPNPNNSLVLVLGHKNFCGMSHDGPLPILGAIPALTMAISIPIGTGLLFFGGRLIKPMSAALGFGFGLLGVSAGFNAFLREPEGLQLLIELGTGAVVGALIVLGIYYKKSIGYFISGIMLGSVIALQTYFLGVLKWETEGNIVNVLHPYSRSSYGRALEFLV